MRGSRRSRTPAHLIVLFAAALLIGGWAAAPAFGHGRRPPIPIAPFLLDPEIGLFDQFGYDPSYTRNVPAFDAFGHPYIRSRTSDPNATSFVNTLVGGVWVQRDFLAAVRAAYPTFSATVGGGGAANDRVVFDREDRMYTLLTVRLTDGSQHNLLLTSADYGATWRVDELPAGVIACEYPVGHNTWSGPPFLAITRPYRGPTAAAPGHSATLWVTKPHFDSGQLVVPDPVLVTNDCIGIVKSAGGASFAVTIGDLTHFVWVEATGTPAAGSPTYAATYDSATNTVGDHVLLTKVLPANDAHTKPGIVSDSLGYLHVLTGAHGSSFEYLGSLAPDDVSGGWTRPVPVLGTGWIDRGTTTERGSQTYLSFDCDPHDTLEIVFRQWRQGVDGLFSGQSYGALSYQRKPAGQPWQDARPIVLPAAAGYSIYYQKTSLDRLGRLWISCSYLSGADVAARLTQMSLWSATGGVQPQPALYTRRMVLVMDQDRLWWHLATTADFEAGVAP